LLTQNGNETVANRCFCAFEPGSHAQARLFVALRATVRFANELLVVLRTTAHFVSRAPKADAASRHLLLMPVFTRQTPAAFASYGASISSRFRDPWNESKGIRLLSTLSTV
jgi:hypothetical protein